MFCVSLTTFHQHQQRTRKNTNFLIMNNSKRRFGLPIIFMSSLKDYLWQVWHKHPQILYLKRLAHNKLSHKSTRNKVYSETYVNPTSYLYFFFFMWNTSKTIHGWNQWGLIIKNIKIRKLYYTTVICLR